MKTDKKTNDMTAQVKVSQLTRWEDQPRKHFDAEKLKELTESVRQHGVLQPLLVREFAGEQADFEVIAGERRLRAAVAAGLDVVRVVIRDISDAQALEIALMENEQRENMLPTEVGNALARLLAMGRERKNLAAIIGRSESYVQGRLSLCEIPVAAQKALDGGLISMHTAEALSRVCEEDQGAALKEVLQPRYETGVLSEKKALELINREYLTPQKQRREYLEAIKKERDAGCDLDALTWEEGRRLQSWEWGVVTEEVPSWKLSGSVTDRKSAPTYGELAEEYGAPVRLAPDLSGEKIGVRRVVSVELLAEAENVWAEQGGHDAERLLTERDPDEDDKVHLKAKRENERAKIEARRELAAELSAELVQMMRTGKPGDIDEAWRVLRGFSGNYALESLEDHFQNHVCEMDADDDGFIEAWEGWLSGFSAGGAFLACELLMEVSSGSYDKETAAIAKLVDAKRFELLTTEGGAE